MVTAPVAPETLIPVPATFEVTPVLPITSVPEVVIGDPEILIPVPAVAATEVTVPEVLENGRSETNPFLTLLSPVS